MVTPPTHRWEILNPVLVRVHPFRSSDPPGSYVRRREGYFRETGSTINPVEGLLSLLVGLHWRPEGFAPKED